MQDDIIGDTKKHGKRCGCGLASNVPLRIQLLILLIVCAIIFIVVAPITIDAFKDSLSVEFEHDTALANIKRAVSAMQQLFSHEEVCLYFFFLFSFFP